MKNILTIGCMAALVHLGGVSASYAVTDDFNDGNDTVSPAWTHLSGYVASSGQTWDASTGQYHMMAPNNGASNLGFVGSYTGAVDTDVMVKSTIVSFVDVDMPPSGPIQGGVFGVAARLNGNNAIAGLAGYAYLYEPGSNGGAGEMTLAQIGPGVNVQDLGDPAGVEGVDWIRDVTLDVNKDYVFTLEVIGNSLFGKVKEVGGPVVAFQTATDATAPYASGYSGYVAYSQGPTTNNPRGVPPTDVTWDNFSSVHVPEPSSLLLLVMAIGLCLTGRLNR